MKKISAFTKQLEKNRKQRRFPTALIGQVPLYVWDTFEDGRFMYEADQAIASRQKKETPLASELLFHDLLLNISPLYSKTFYKALELNTTFKPVASSFYKVRLDFDPLSRHCNYPASLNELKWHLANPSVSADSLNAFSQTLDFKFPYFHDLFHVVMNSLVPPPKKSSPKKMADYFSFIEALVIQYEAAFLEELGDLYHIIAKLGIFWPRPHMDGLTAIMSDDESFNRNLLKSFKRQKQEPSASSIQWMPEYLKRYGFYVSENVLDSTFSEIQDYSYQKLSNHPEQLTALKVWLKQSLLQA